MPAARQPLHASRLPAVPVVAIASRSQAARQPCQPLASRSPAARQPLASHSPAARQPLASRLSAAAHQLLASCSLATRQPLASHSPATRQPLASHSPACSLGTMCIVSSSLCFVTLCPRLALAVAGMPGSIPGWSPLSSGNNGRHFSSSSAS